jgi:carbamoyl-phosphate synthase large subunit
MGALLFVNRLDRTSYLRGIAESLRSLYPNIRLVGTDEYSPSPISTISDEFEVLPEPTDVTFCDRVIEIVTKYNVIGLVASSNSQLRPLLDIKDHLERIGVRVLVPSARALDISLDKVATGEFLNGHGIRTPKVFSHPRQPKESWDKITAAQLPVVIKPVAGVASVDTFVVKDLKRLEILVKLFPCSLVQEYINGIHYTVDVFSDETGEPFCVVPRIRRHVAGSLSVVGQIDMNPEIISVATAVFQSFREPGLMNLQVIRSMDGCLYVHDLNPRAASGVVLSMKAGAPFAHFLVELLMTGSIVNRDFSIRNGLTMYRSYSEWYF